MSTLVPTEFHLFIFSTHDMTMIGIQKVCLHPNFMSVKKKEPQGNYCWRYGGKSEKKLIFEDDQPETMSVRAEIALKTVFFLPERVEFKRL